MAKFKKIRIPKNELEISSFAFCNCVGLESIVIHDKVERIGHSAFSGCVKLKDINIPESVTEIGASAFANCSSIKTIILPSSLKKLGKRAFEGCDNLEKVIFLGTDTKVLMFRDDSSSIPIFCKKGSWIQLRCDKMKIPYTLLED